MAVIERNVDLSVVGANGGGWAVDLGAAIPTAPTAYDSTLAVALLPLGAISEDGLNYGFDENKQDFFAWGQLTPYRSQVTQSLRTFQVTLWETNRAICKSLMFRKEVSAVTVDGSGEFTFAETAQPAPDRRSFVFDVMDGETIERFFVPVGEVTNRESVSYKNDEISGYRITITTYADSVGNTVYHYGKVILAGS
jgi:hypothetical protein